MAGSLLPEPKQQFLNDIGVPLFGGKIFTYAAGTLTPQATYQDQALTIENTNPVIANARGEVVMYGSGTYRIILQDLFGNTIYDRDNIETPDVISGQITAIFAAPSGSSRIGFIQSDGSAVQRTVQDELRDFVKPEQFGALGGGANDTLALQRAIATGRDVYFSRIYTYQDVSLNIATPGQKLFGPGGVIQKSVAVSNVPANPTASYPASGYPAILMSAAGGQLLIGSVTAAWEGVQISAPNCEVLYCNIKASDVNWYDGILPYSDDFKIIGNTVEGFGTWAVAANAYRIRGDGIFVSAGPSGGNKGGIIALNQVRSCSRNGLFIIGQRGFSAVGNVIEGCGMSAIQIAFLNGLAGGNAHSFSITGNTGRYCGADSIDINNASVSDNEELHAEISGNTFEENGFYFTSAALQLSRVGGGVSTNDGAGYTLIKVSHLRSTGNYFKNCGRAVVFASSCTNLDINDSGYKATSNPIDDTDGLRINTVKNSVFRLGLVVPGNLYRADGDNSNSVISDSHWQNTVPGKMAITTPTGATPPVFRSSRIFIESGGFLNNYQSPIYDCVFSSADAGTATISGVVDLVDVKFYGNSLNISIIDPAEVTLRGVSIIGNSPTGPLLQIRNSLNGHYHDVLVANAGSSAAVVFYGSATTGVNYLRNVTAKNFGGGNSLRIEAEVPASVTFFMDEVISSPGFPDLAGGTRKTLTWV